MNNVEYIGPVYLVGAIAAEGAGAARRLASGGPATLSRPSPRPVIRGESPPAQLPDSGFIRLRTVLAVFPVSRATWWRGIKSGKYPAGVKIGARAAAWRVEDIRRLIEQCADSRP